MKELRELQEGVKNVSNPPPNKVIVAPFFNYYEASLS